ncbi:MAG: DEAD/DEAH box helicase [Salibacteraceae bacterium]
MKFEDYHIADGIKKAIAKLGYKKPTDIQYKSIPAILKGEDVLAIAQTGTGKTAAFAIPILHKLQERKVDRRPSGIKCLVMTPTHELALQVESVFNTLGKHTNVTTYCIHGGVEQDPQKEKLEEGVDILVVTPGRMFDLISQGALRLDKVEILVLDEADHMLDLGFIGDIRGVMHNIPWKKQTLFFSATINDKIKDIAYSLVHSDAIRIQISPKDPVAKNIEHSVAYIEMDDKRYFLESLINSEPDKKMLVFVRTKVRAERLKKAMERVGLVTDTIHSDREHVDRERTMSQFRKGELKVLIATDVSARGIDIPNVEFVVNYDLPETAAQYVHRVGRTGRGTNKGQAYSFCSTQEKELLKEIEENLGKPIARLQVSKTEYENVVNATIEVAPDKKYDVHALIAEAEEAIKKGKKRKGRKKGK